MLRPEAFWSSPEPFGKEFIACSTSGTVIFRQMVIVIGICMRLMSSWYLFEECFSCKAAKDSAFGSIGWLLSHRMRVALQMFPSSSLAVIAAISVSSGEFSLKQWGFVGFSVSFPSEEGLLCWLLIMFNNSLLRSAWIGWLRKVAVNSISFWFSGCATIYPSISDSFTGVRKTCWFLNVLNHAHMWVQVIEKVKYRSAGIGSNQLLKVTFVLINLIGVNCIGEEGRWDPGR